MVIDLNEPNSKNTSKLSMRLDLRVVIVILLLVIAGMLFFWRPWSSPVDTGRTISVTGSATLKATPDEYIFSPQYEFKNANKAAGLAALSAKSDEVVAKLKALGVPSANIKTDSSGYNYGYFYDASASSYNYNLGLTVTVDDAGLAQKVQNYLISTSPSGEITPNVQFSTAKRKQLEDQARDQATKDARAKADQSAGNLGFSVGAVKSVKDGGFGGGIRPYQELSIASGSTSSAASNMNLQPGQNDLDYSVTVVYYIR